MASATQDGIASRVRLVAVVVGCCCAILALPANAEPSHASSAAAEVHARGGYPSTLPRPAAFPPSDNPSSASSASTHGFSPSTRPSVPDSTSHTTDPAWGSIVVIVLVVGLVIALVALLALGRFGGATQQRPSQLTRAPDPANETGRPNTAMEDVAVLIAAGRLDEALVVLFARACEHLGLLPEVSDASRTARELLARIDTADPRHIPFRTVVHRVERVRFAGRSATHEDLRDVSDAVDQLRAIGARR